MPFPVELRLPGVRVVSLAASGKSVHIVFPFTIKHPHILLFPCTNRAFHALDADGNVHIWGEGDFDLFSFRAKMSGYCKSVAINPSQLPRHPEWNIRRIEK